MHEDVEGGEGKSPQRVRLDQPFALPNPQAPWPVVADEPRSMSLVYLEDAEKDRETKHHRMEESWRK